MAAHGTRVNGDISVDRVAVASEMVNDVLPEDEASVEKH